MKMNKKLSLTLLVAMVSLLIIGFGGVATAQAAGNCTETLLVNVSASESTTFTNCRSLQADAARYTSLAAFYTNEKTSIQRAFEADAARYTGLAALYTADAARKCLGIGSTDMTSAELVTCLSDSAYQAANPELMVSHRFVVANGSATTEPAPAGIQTLYNRFLSNIEEIRATQTGPAAKPVDIEVLRNNYYNNLWAAKHGYYYSSSTAQTDPAAEPVDIKALQMQNLILDRNYYHPGR